MSIAAGLSMIDCMSVMDGISIIDGISMMDETSMMDAISVMDGIYSNVCYLPNKLDANLFKLSTVGG
jgi:hypothetical protein